MDIKVLLSDNKMRAISSALAPIIMMVVLILIVAIIGTVVVDVAGSFNTSESTSPSVSMSMDYDEETQTANITYMGGSQGGEEVAVYANDVEVDRDGWRDDWNGDTTQDILSSGSTHTMSSVSPGTEIQVTVWVSEYDEPAEMTFVT